MSRSIGLPWRVCAGAALVLLVLGACGSGGSDDSSGATGGAGSDGGPAVAAEPAPYSYEEAAQEAAAGPTGGGQRAATLPSIGPSVIKTAEIRLEVAEGNLEDAIRSATAAAGRYGGFVLSTRVSGDERLSGHVVIRVPSTRFEAALTDVSELGETVGETIAGEDVGEEFVDLEARLRNLEAQEAVMLRLMQRAGTVGATIRVQNQLSGIQLEIERIEGRLRFLRDQTELATIGIDLTEVTAPGARPGVIERAWENATETTVSVVSGIVLAGGFVLPFAVLALVGLFVFRLIRPRLTS